MNDPMEGFRSGFRPRSETAAESAPESPPDSVPPADQAAASADSSAAKTRSRSSAPGGTRDDFQGPLVPLQVKVPQDLVQSLKLHAISENCSMSDIVVACLTGERFIAKAWISTRRAG